MNSVPRAVPGSLTTLQKLWRVAAVAGYSAIRAARAQWHIFRSHDEGHTMVPHPTFACQVRGGLVPCVCQSCFASMHTHRLVEAPVAVSVSVCVGVDVCLRAYACVQVVGAARAHARRESLRTYPTVNKTILYSESYPSTVIEVCARLVRRESRYKGVTAAGRMCSPYGRCRTASL